MQLENIEICCNSYLSARNAKAAGARRIELCQALGEGGTTPTSVTIEECHAGLGLHTRVLIRPRGGNFEYDEEDKNLCFREIYQAGSFGADAVVIGFLDAEGNIDVETTCKAVRLAKENGLGVTFHRAFDCCRDPLAALEQIIDCGCDKLLTSGCAPTAWEGREMIRNLVEQANGRIGIIAASGINASNVAGIIDSTGVQEVHASCKKTVDDMTYTDIDEVKKLMAAVAIK